MSNAEQIKPYNYEKLLSFVKEVSNNFCFNQSDDEALRMLVYFEEKAYNLLTELGEIK
jgi:hypothetical protein